MLVLSRIFSKLEKAHNKAADTLIVAYPGVEKPMTIVQRSKIPLRKRVLLDKQVARKHPETQLHAVLLAASMYIRAGKPITDLELDNGRVADGRTLRQYVADETAKEATR